MNNTLILIVSVSFLALLFLTYFITNKKANAKIEQFKTLSDAISTSSQSLSQLEDKIEKAKIILLQHDNETKELQELKKNADAIASELDTNTEKLNKINSKIQTKTNELGLKKKELQDLMAKLDLYSRVDEFAEYGHFEIPEYLYETSARFAEEIKRVRQKQKDQIKDAVAVTYPETTTIASDNSYNKKILNGQVKLMLAAFNTECDFIISKVSPSNYPRTLERIEKLANTLEKSAATLHCGFNIKYVELKFEECQLQYQHTLKKKAEQDEQRLIREQIREEQQAAKEYERAIAQAAKEEHIYRDMLNKAREELHKTSDDDRITAEQRIADLEKQLAEAVEKEERAKSMAEQTRKGHVYVISNVGSFGDNVYKIGLTRRLDPLDRVKELGDASVPFPFDVHAMIYTEDAPALEAALHREFTNSRVNAVNLRKEFFRTDLESIRKTVEKISGCEAEFKMTILAEEYHETLRLLQEAEPIVA